MAPHSSTLAWKIPWTEEPGGLQSMRPGKAGISGLHSRLPRGVRPRLEGKPRTPLSSRVATRLPVHYQHPESTQTHVHRVGNAIQPSHPLSSPSPPAPNPSQHGQLAGPVLFDSRICTLNQGSSTPRVHSDSRPLLGYVRLFETPWTIQSMEFSRPEYWSG